MTLSDLPPTPPWCQTAPPPCASPSKRVRHRDPLRHAAVPQCCRRGRRTPHRLMVPPTSINSKNNAHKWESDAVRHCHPIWETQIRSFGVYGRSITISNLWSNFYKILKLVESIGILPWQIPSSRCSICYFCVLYQQMYYARGLSVSLTTSLNVIVVIIRMCMHTRELTWWNITVIIQNIVFICC
jgi:hypothetical protein